MTNLIWLHEEALRANHKVFEKAEQNCQPIFIWDEFYFRQMDYSFKRLVFIYETLCQLPCDIYQGETFEVLSALAQSHSATTMYIPQTPNPALILIAQKLSKSLNVITVPDEPFVVLDKEPNLRRFFNYWKIAENKAFRKFIYP